VQYQKLTADFQNDLAGSGLKAADKKAAASAASAGDHFYCYLGIVPPSAAMTTGSVGFSANSCAGLHCQRLTFRAFGNKALFPKVSKQG
jgi:hypothetical protein